MTRSVGRLREGVADWLNQWLPDRSREGREETGLSSMLNTGVPAVDVVEDENDIRVTAELPGIDKDDFRVEVVGDRLVLRGEKKAAREERKGEYYYAERSYGSFARSVQLPCEVDIDNAKATFKNGELKLVLPKTEGAKSRRFKVNVE